MDPHGALVELRKNAGPGVRRLVEMAMEMPDGELSEFLLYSVFKLILSVDRLEQRADLS